MKKAICLVLALLLSGLLPMCALSECGHEDDGASIIYDPSEYKPATQTEDGHTAPGRCSLCGAILVPSTVIPRTGPSETDTPAPTDTPSSVPTDTPAPATDTPSPVPTDTPAPATDTPSPVPTDTPAPATDTPSPVPTGTAIPALTGTPAPDLPFTPAPTPVAVTETPVPSIVTPPPSLEPTTEPPAVTAPPTLTPTAVPDAVYPYDPSDPWADLLFYTSQPDLSLLVPPSSAWSYSSSGASSGSSSSSRRGSSSSSSSARIVISAPSSGRDLTRYPIFSSRFPWRRLRMSPAEGIQVHLAGVLIWRPADRASSPLQVMLGD